MSKFTNFGTQWAETEALVEVMHAFDAWDGDGTPEFNEITRRLREAFDERALRDFEVILLALSQFVKLELMRRSHVGCNTESTQGE